jgi:hypothetical protein
LIGDLPGPDQVAVTHYEAGNPGGLDVEGGAGRFEERGPVGEGDIGEEDLQASVGGEVERHVRFGQRLIPVERRGATVVFEEAGEHFVDHVFTMRAGGREEEDCVDHRRPLA